MTRDEVRAAARRMVQWHGRFSGLFGRKESREHSLLYVKGLLSNLERKSVEPIALHFSRGPDGGAATQNEVVALQGFVTASPWEAGDVFAEIQAVFAEELVPSASQWSIGTVGVIDESGFVKAGTERCAAVFSGGANSLRGLELSSKFATGGCRPGRPAPSSPRRCPHPNGVRDL